MGAYRLEQKEGLEVSVKIKIANSRPVRVKVYVERPEWREFLYY